MGSEYRPVSLVCAGGEKAVWRHAALSSVREFRWNGDVQRGFQIGVVVTDQRRVATKLASRITDLRASNRAASTVGLSRAAWADTMKKLLWSDVKLAQVCSEMIPNKLKQLWSQGKPRSTAVRRSTPRALSHGALTMTTVSGDSRLLAAAAGASVAKCRTLIDQIPSKTESGVY